VTVYEFRCSEHPDSLQVFDTRYSVPASVVCHWVTRGAAGELERCERVLTPAVRTFVAPVRLDPQDLHVHHEQAAGEESDDVHREPAGEHQRGASHPRVTL
jgi:hypothetical protein